MGLWWEHLVDVRALLERVVEDRLDYDTAYQLAFSMLRGELDDVVIAAILAAMRARGEAAEEVAGFAKALRDSCVRVDTGGKRVLDTAGTGGDKSHTINASTAAAIVASALGAYVAKHGNRSVSSRSGSADFMEKLGYDINHGAREAECMLKKARFTFLYAPRFHPAMAKVMPVRRKLGIRTIFNLVGPLSNPALAKHQVLGVASKELMRVIAEAGAILGYERLLVVHGEPGIDEVSVSGVTHVIEVSRDGVEEYRLTPEELRVERHPIHELRVSSVEESVARVLAVFRGGGRRSDRDFIAVNAGLALYAAGLYNDVTDAVEAAKQALDEGVVYEHLEHILRVNRECCRLQHHSGY